MENTSELCALVPKGEERRCVVPRHDWTKRVGVGAVVSLAVLALVCLSRESGQPSGGDQLASGAAFLEKAAAHLPLVQPPAQQITRKPQADPRSYQYARLTNGLHVLNVQDEKAMKTAFAMAVQSGSFNDPKEFPGLAHFCEHMLFLGTEKYPNSTDFSDFMAKSGGSDNAYTADELTVYFGEVSKGATKEASDRYADFFRAPLFSQKFVKKEVHAIDSEHAKNVQNPSWRIMELLSSVADERSPVSKFHTGNFDTLYDIPRKNGTSPVDALKVYFKRHYCPSKMQLVTFGPAPLAEQLRMANEDFGRIKPGSLACQGPLKKFAKPDPYPPGSLAKWLVAKGTEPEPSMWLHFPLPDLTADFRSQPLSYIDHVLGYRGVDSFARVLADSLGLAHDSQTSYAMNSAGTSLFFICSLTSRGTQHLEIVLDVFFSYLATLRRAGVDKELYQTIADVAKLKWDWMEPAGAQDAASSLAEQMTRLPPQKLLTGDSLIERLNTNLVSSLLERLTPENMNVAYINPNASNTTLFKGQHVETLPYYDVLYTERELSDVLPGAAARWRDWLAGRADAASIQKHISQRLQDAGIRPISTPFPVVPKPIADVPKEIPKDNMKSEAGDPDKDSVVVALYGPLPRKLEVTAADLQGQGGLNKRHLRTVEPEIWYRRGWVTHSPKVEIGLSLRPLRSPDEPENPVLDFVRLELYTRLLGEEMEPKMVDLTATGVSYSISVSLDGLTFSFGGFAPVLPQLVRTVLKEFNEFNRNFTLTPPSRFHRIHQEFHQELNSYTDMPVSYAVHDAGLLLKRGRHSRKELLSVLGSVTLESAVKSAGELLFSRPLQLTGLAMGNMREEEARSFLDNISHGIEIPEWMPTDSGDGDAEGEVEHIKPVSRLAKPVEVRMKNPRDGDENDVAVVSIVAETLTVESRVVFYLLGQILGNLAYSELRTKRQLGYVVQAGTSQVSNVHTITCLVQGTVLGADDAEAAIEGVLTQLMPEKLSNTTEEDFSSYVSSLTQDLLQPPISPSDEVAQFLGPINQGGECFELHDEILAYLNTSSVTKQLLMETWRKHVLLEEGTRRKIAVKYFAGEVPPRPAEESARATWLKQGASEGSLAMLSREHLSTEVLGHVDSAVRSRLVSDGGLFPTDLHCRMERAA